MNRRLNPILIGWYIIILLILLGLLAAACGGDDAPVPMEQHESDAFTIQVPEDWQTDSMDMLGFSVLIGSSKDVQAQSFFEGAELGAMFSDAPGVIAMVIPAEMADGEFSVDEIKRLPEEEPNVEIVKQGDVTIDGVRGYQLIARGKFGTLGDAKMGVHTAILERDNDSFVFMGFSPDLDLDKNLDIFAYIFESIKYK